MGYQKQRAIWSLKSACRIGDIIEAEIWCGSIGLSRIQSLVLISISALIAGKVKAYRISDGQAKLRLCVSLSFSKQCSIRKSKDQEIKFPNVIAFISNSLFSMRR